MLVQSSEFQPTVGEGSDLTPTMSDSHTDSRQWIRGCMTPYFCFCFFFGPFFIQASALSPCQNFQQSLVRSSYETREDKLTSAQDKPEHLRGETTAPFLASSVDSSLFRVQIFFPTTPIAQRSQFPLITACTLNYNKILNMI